MDALELFELTIAMLFAVIALHWCANRLRLPPSVALILGGAALAFLPGIPAITLDPELVLVVFLPPLLLDGAWFIPLRHLRRHLLGILSLAIGAVLFTTIVVAVVAHALLPLPWAACAALGAIVSPPDAISARAVLQRVHLPDRLSTLLEGESLLNDATGLVLFRFAVAAAATGTFSAVDAIGSFLLLALGGVAVGIAVGAAWVFVMKRLRDEYLAIASSVLLCWAAYLLGETIFHVSGVLATVVAGLICGWYQHVVFSATVRMRGMSFWTVMIFLLEASVFLLIGSSLREVIDRVGGIHVVLAEMAVPILWILLALTLARFAWVYGSDALIALQRLLGFRRYRPVGPRSALVLSWAGMRGVVTLAVALSVPESMPGRDFMLIAAFAVILVTVLGQGMSLGAVIRWARPDAASEHGGLTMSEAEATMARAQLRVVQERAYDAGGTLIHPQLLERYRMRAEVSQRYAGNEVELSPRLHAHFDLILEVVAAGRAELLRLHRAGEIDDHTLHELERDLDLEELAALSAKSS